MSGYSEKECVGCERCGAFIPKALVQFHRCPGSDLSKRPANISAEDWLESVFVRSALNSPARNQLPDFDRLFDRMTALHTKSKALDDASWMSEYFETSRKKAAQPSRVVVFKFPRTVLVLGLVLLGVALGLLVARLLS